MRKSTIQYIIFHNKQKQHRNIKTGKAALSCTPFSDMVSIFKHSEVSMVVLKRSGTTTCWTLTNLIHGLSRIVKILKTCISQCFCNFSFEGARCRHPMLATGTVMETLNSSSTQMGILFWGVPDYWLTFDLLVMPKLVAKQTGSPPMQTNCRYLCLCRRGPSKGKRSI